ncbi:MAG: PIN domain-containing protein [Candidatus Aminicenantes bacterium]|nr:MAG: PIN domain-containing protein [Candidatus Aminicenantes bacterium]
MSNYLIDTSIWIDFFQGRKGAIKKRVHDLLDQNRVFTNGVIIAELLVGAAGKKETIFVKENLLKLNYLETDRDFFVYCGELGNQLRKAGLNVPFSDLVIAAQAKGHNLCVFTRDNHFESIGLTLGIQFEILKNF